MMIPKPVDTKALVAIIHVMPTFVKCVFATTGKIITNEGKPPTQWGGEENEGREVDWAEVKALPSVKVGVKMVVPATMNTPSPVEAWMNKAPTYFQSYFLELVSSDRLCEADGCIFSLVCRGWEQYR